MTFWDNFYLFKQILNTNLKKLKKSDGNLKLINDVFKNQIQQGIIERVDNLSQFIKENPAHSFLPHMAVIKPERESTKCRVVFLATCLRKTLISS